MEGRHLRLLEAHAATENSLPVYTSYCSSVRTYWTPGLDSGLGFQLVISVGDVNVSKCERNSVLIRVDLCCNAASSKSICLLTLVVSIVASLNRYVLEAEPRCGNDGGDEEIPALREIRESSAGPTVWSEFGALAAKTGAINLGQVCDGDESRFRLEACRDACMI